MKQVVLLLKEYLNSWPSQTTLWVKIINSSDSISQRHFEVTWYPYSSLKGSRFWTELVIQTLQWLEMEEVLFVLLKRSYYSVFFLCFVTLYPTKAFLGAWAMVLMELNRSNFALKDSFIWPWLMVPTMIATEGHHWIKICWSGREGERGRGLENL